MQTRLAAFIRDTSEGREADAILRSCVHCGFCTATCPTYQLLGDELDGPRGRIYLIKQVLEGEDVSQRTQLHLDRCLTCRACETTCPSGVRYGRLADIGRGVVEEKVRRPWLDRVQRRLLRLVLPYPQRFTRVLKIAGLFRALLPAAFKSKLPATPAVSARPTTRHNRRMLALEGCVQSVLAPTINQATAKVLDQLGISLLSASRSGCCGALSYHLSAHEEGLNFMRRNIDAWWPHVEEGVEAVVMTASGCGVMVKDYGKLLQHDPLYAEKAARVSALTRDIGEILLAEDCSSLGVPVRKKIALHLPCTLQHGQRLGGTTENLLSRLGFTLTPVVDAHLCCGSAGTYSILQPELSQRLLVNKIEALEAGDPEVIATGNIGCMVHLQSCTQKPVRHWIELLAGSDRSSPESVIRNRGLDTAEN